jgi:uncharacterized protein YlzI (FlbEa/FlbD family)
MTRRLALTVPLFVALLSGMAWSAQQAPEKPAAPVKKDERIVVEKPARGAAKPKRIEEIVKFSPGPNVRVEFTLTDQQSGAPTTSKTVMLTTGNRTWGRLRSQIESRLYGMAPLNVDARPTVTPDGHVNVELTIDYSTGRNAEAEGNPDKIQVIRINQSLTTLLENGKPLLVTQSADPVSDRKVTVEVKATIVN